MRPDAHHHHHQDHQAGRECGPGFRGPRHRQPGGGWNFGPASYGDRPERFGGPGEGWGDFEAGGRGRGGRGPRGRGRGRAARGDIRAGVLALLTEEPMHGYQIMRELAERSNGAWRPSPGSVYPTLQQLEDEGLVVAEKEGRGRRLFSLTEDGAKEVAARESERAPWEAVADDEPSGHHALRREVKQLIAAIQQVGGAGTDDQLRRTVALLKETRRGVYRILAEDEAETTKAPDPGGEPEADAS